MRLSGTGVSVPVLDAELDVIPVSAVNSTSTLIVVWWWPHCQTTMARRRCWQIDFLHQLRVLRRIEE